MTYLPRLSRNDIHGFITNQNIHQRASKALYLGLTFQYRGYHTEPGAEKQQAYKDAIAHYDRAIELDSEERYSYNNRGECWLHLEVWDKARKDLTIAQDMGADIVAAFHKDYKGGIKEFEEKTGIKLPKWDYCIVRVLEERIPDLAAGALFGFGRRWTFRSVVFSGLRASTPIAKSKTAYAITMFMILLISLAFFICFQGKNYDRIGFRGDSIGFTSNR